jgi:glycosyltransferase involved in cell wall biosynthesis
MLYKISHVQLTELDSLVLTPDHQYVVVWWNNIPLGHAWITPPEDAREKLRVAIQPALDYYREHGSSLHTINTGCRLSVVICTRNRPQSLAICLQSLLSCTDQDFELLVIDNAPDDDATFEVTRKFPAVKYVREKRKGLDIARNTGARTATGDLIAYTDDDVQIPANWIANLKACFNDPLTMAVTGLVIPASLDTYAQYIFEKKWGFNKGYLPRRFDHRYFLDHSAYGVPAWDVGAGANMAFRKDVFLLAGLFDERLDVGASGCSGDSEMWYRILAEGWNCYYVPELYVFHEHRSSDTGLRQQLFSYMRGHVSALLVQHENYQQRGELRRLYKGLPHYYLKRLKQWLQRTHHENLRHIMMEIKGCYSGWQFYNAHKQFRRQDITVFPPALQQPVPVTEHSLVSVIIPCYNHAEYLKQAIDSALGQSWKQVEVIVIDDGSTDNTAAVCAHYSAQITYIRVERVGLSAARNIGVQLSKGQFLIFLDADDYLYEGAAELQLYYFKLYPHAGFISGAHDRVDKSGAFLNTVYHNGDGYLSLLQGNYIGMESCILYRRDLFFHFHFDTRLTVCEDYDLNLNIARHLFVFHHNNRMAAYRIHDMNMSTDKTRMLKWARQVLQKQLPALQNEQERLAWQQGLNNWTSYYTKRNEHENE